MNLGYIVSVTFVIAMAAVVFSLLVWRARVNKKMDQCAVFEPDEEALRTFVMSSNMTTTATTMSDYAGDEEDEGPNAAKGRKLTISLCRNVVGKPLTRVLAEEDKLIITGGSCSAQPSKDFIIDEASGPVAHIRFTESDGQCRCVLHNDSVSNALAVYADFNRVRPNEEHEIRTNSMIKINNTVIKVLIEEYSS